MESSTWPLNSHNCSENYPKTKQKHLPSSTISILYPTICPLYHTHYPPTMSHPLSHPLYHTHYLATLYRHYFTQYLYYLSSPAISILYLTICRLYHTHYLPTMSHPLSVHCITPTISIFIHYRHSVSLSSISLSSHTICLQSALYITITICPLYHILTITKSHPLSAADSGCNSGYQTHIN